MKSVATAMYRTRATGLWLPASAELVGVPRRENTPSPREEPVRDRIYLAQGDLGIGVFAKRFLRMGDYILTFTGPEIDFAEACAKGEKECYPLQVGPNLYIDLV